MRIPFLSKIIDRHTMEYQNKILETQVAEVQNMYHTMRGWRHDYHNHLQTMKAYVHMGEYTSLDEYLALLELDLNQFDSLVESGNVNLDAILNSKISLALHQGILVECKANCPKEVPLSNIDLCALMGNLLDNAMEACAKQEPQDEKFIRIYIGIIKKQFYISITNSTNEVVRKMDAQYITNKRGNHGFGLRRINQVVDKYQGYLNRQNEPGVFVTEIMIPM